MAGCAFERCFPLTQHSFPLKIKQSYKSSLDCALKTLRAEGPRGLYKGFTPQWMRIGPHTIVTFMVFERLRSIVHVNPI